MISAKEVALLIKKYLERNPAGGDCHVVLDDGNIDDADIDFCIKECKGKGDQDGLTVLEFMKQMRKTARLKTVYLARELNKTNE